MKLCSIRSSSRGNAILVSHQNTHILVDCGISGKLAKEGLSALSVKAEDVSAIVITHEHTDHICGVGVMARRYGLSIFANEKTWAAMAGTLGEIPKSQINMIEKDSPFSIGDVTVKGFSIPHDAADPMGYTFVCGDKKLAVATDIGALQEDLFRNLKGSGAVLLEANHDVQLLQISNYPLSLKQRIRSDRGHLSNEDAAHAIKLLAKMGTRHILLGHLSPENNYPLLALQTVKAFLLEEAPQLQVALSVAPQNEVSEIIEI